MFKKVIELYLKKTKQKLVTDKDFEHILNYRATRGELKTVIDDYNVLLQKASLSMTVKDMNVILNEKIKEKLPSKKTDVQSLFYDTLKKEFKKY